MFYLLEPFYLLLQFGLPGASLIFLQACARRASSFCFSLQLVQLQVLQLFPQVFDKLSHRKKNKSVKPEKLDSHDHVSKSSYCCVCSNISHLCKASSVLCTATGCLTSCVASFSFWFWWRSWLSLSAIFLRDSLSSLSRSDMASVSSCSFLFSWRITKNKQTGEHEEGLHFLIIQ